MLMASLAGIPSTLAHKVMHLVLLGLLLHRFDWDLEWDIFPKKPIKFGRQVHVSDDAVSTIRSYPKSPRSETENYQGFLGWYKSLKNVLLLFFIVSLFWVRSLQ